MAQFRANNPYDPHFALPCNVMAEPPGRGTFTTAQMRRKTFFDPPSCWISPFAVPGYVRAEPIGRGTFTTAQARRKTIPVRIPESLGDSAAPLPVPGFVGDPIKAYGERASEYLLGTIRAVPVEFRGVGLQALLDEVEPGLYDRVTERANEYKGRGMDDASAVKSAMASSMSEGIVREMIKLGSGRTPSVRSQFGLGYYGETSREIALDGLWSSIKNGVKKAAKKVKSGAEWVGGKVSWPARKAAQGVSKGVEYAKKGAQKTWEWGKQAVDKLGSLACGVMQSPVVSVAAGAAATAYGAPASAGAAGAEGGAKLCGKADVPAAPPQLLMVPPSSGIPKWVIPAAVGGAGLMAALLLARR